MLKIESLRFEMAVKLNLNSVHIDVPAVDNLQVRFEFGKIRLEIMKNKRLEGLINN